MATVKIYGNTTQNQHFWHVLFWVIFWIFFGNGCLFNHPLIVPSIQKKIPELYDTRNASFGGKKSKWRDLQKCEDRKISDILPWPCSYEQLPFQVAGSGKWKRPFSDLFAIQMRKLNMRY